MSTEGGVPFHCIGLSISRDTAPTVPGQLRNKLRTTFLHAGNFPGLFSGRESWRLRKTWSGPSPRNIRSFLGNFFLARWLLGKMLAVIGYRYQLLCDTCVEISRIFFRSYDTFQCKKNWIHWDFVVYHYMIERKFD